jgi:hypothetical protein
MSRSALKNLQSLKEDLKQYPMPTPTDIAKAEVAALTSKSLQDFAEFLDIDLITIKVWARKSKAFYNAINSWETVATFEIKKAMAKRAVGFTKTTSRDVMTKTGNIETLHIETYYPPSETAGSFWLKNKAADEFQDKKEIDVNLNANIRAWLVSAGGQLDPSEIIDGIATEVNNDAGNLITNEIANIIETELDDGTSEREAAMVAECIIEAEANIQAEANAASDLNAPIDNEIFNGDATSDALSIFNKKWSWL